MSHLTRLLPLALGIACLASAAEGSAAGFAGFDARAKAGEHLSVVFFGCSLTWGANASDPTTTSYRAVVRDRLEEAYPQAHFRCWDAAIGGTNSLLGVYRVERDVLRRRPDLVFVDFTANDGAASTDEETLASYEAILERLATASIPVVQVAFPFKWDIDRAALPRMARLRAHRELADLYGNGWGDAITRITAGVEQGRYTREQLWVTDGVHPHDPGYAEFAAAAWDGYQQAVASALVPHVPAAPRYATTYRHARRVLLAERTDLPAGWTPGAPHLTACNHDWLMSRWMDGLVVCSNREQAHGKATAVARPVAPWRLRVRAASILLFGEATPASGRFRVLIDGQPVTGLKSQVAGTDLFEGNRWKTGNGHLTYEIARGLDESHEHEVVIEPVFSPDAEQELRLESICVAGADPSVSAATP